MTYIVSITKTSSGHWRVIAERYNYSRRYPIRVTSVTRWTHLTTNSMAIDDYHSDDKRRVKRGEKALIREVKWKGFRENEKN